MGDTIPCEVSKDEHIGEQVIAQSFLSVFAHDEQ